VHIECCNNQPKDGNLTFLKDIKNFTARKMFAFKCPHCNQYRVWISETRIDDNKIFTNLLKGKAAINFAARENKAKRLLQTLPDIRTLDLTGWVYGVNKQIKNKKGEVTQIRQYASDFHGKKKLVKKSYL